MWQMLSKQHSTWKVEDNLVMQTIAQVLLNKLVYTNTNDTNEIQEYRVHILSSKQISLQKRVFVSSILNSIFETSRPECPIDHDAYVCCLVQWFLPSLSNAAHHALSTECLCTIHMHTVQLVLCAGISSSKFRQPDGRALQSSSYCDCTCACVSIHISTFLYHLPDIPLMLQFPFL